MGVVDSLKEWRKERSSCYQIIGYMEKHLQKEVLDCYKGCKDDPGIIPIPKEPRLKAWKSFSIVSMDVNYFGFGDEETWLNFVDERGEEYYEEYLQTHESLIKGEILEDNRVRTPGFHRWDNSSAQEKFRKEMKYSGWFKDYNGNIGYEILDTLDSISHKIKDYKGIEWEARVPKCNETCGTFIMDINQFIVEAVKQRIKSSARFDI
jgi:hypothetical protein